MTEEKKEEEKNDDQKTTRRSNFNPSLWGESTWKFMHFVALCYPEKPSDAKKELYRRFFKSIGQVLPCDKCIVNYASHLKKFPIDKYLAGPDELFAWTVIMRNEVEKTLKSSRRWDIEILKEQYFSENDESNIETGRIFNFINLFMPGI